jgi:RNA polymerase-binding transcription factor DksA
MGDLVDQANADAEADLHIRLHQSDAHLLRAIEDALARITQDRFGACEWATLPFPRRGSKPCLRLVCVATARSASSQPLENNVR